MGWGGFCGVVRCGRQCGRAKSHGYKRGVYIDVVGWLGDAWVRAGGYCLRYSLYYLGDRAFPQRAVLMVRGLGRGF